MRVFEAAGVDLVSAFTMTYAEEAIGIVRAAEAAAVPAVISFTVETDGKLRSGMTLAEAITACDAATGGYAAYYMVNCAHPEHFRQHLAGPWVERIGGIRANASKMSHDELDDAPELDAGNPEELALDYRGLLRAPAQGARCSAAAAAPTIATSRRSAAPAATPTPPERRGGARAAPPRTASGSARLPEARGGIAGRPFNSGSLRATFQGGGFWPSREGPYPSGRKHS